jgi:sulfur relay (sulfurtransferase) DsrC/TusE family protein
MTVVEIVTTTSSTLIALGVISGVIAMFYKKTARHFGRVAAQELQEKDIDPKSYLGQALEWNKQTDGILEKIVSQLTKNDLSTKRLELLVMIHTSPTAVRLIEEVYEEYVKMGGNSYIVHEIIPAWRKKYAKKIAEERI